MGAFAFPAGVGFMDEARFPDGFDQVAEGMVDDPVTERGCRDTPGLTVIDHEVAVAAGEVGLRLEFTLEFEQFLVQVALEAATWGRLAFPAPGFPESHLKVFKGV